MNNQLRIERMHALLQEAFQPDRLEITDQSHLHVGHPGAKTGKGHFQLLIQAKALTELSSVKAHQAIYQALGTMMQNDIHALSINILR
jgi:BolA family transcriptional regulator, general stress-responsive regulator